MRQGKESGGKLTGRSLCVMIAALALCAFCVIRLANLQIVMGADYREQSMRRIMRTMPVAAPRGEILDRYGRAFVKNRMGYSVMLDRVTLPREEQNDLILRLLDTLEENGITYTDSLPVTEAPYAYISGSEDAEKKVKSFLKAKNFNENTTAVEAMSRLMDKYGLNGYSERDARRLAGIRYDMENAGFSMTNPFTVASDVDMTTVTTLRERYDSYPGVTIEIEPVREYASGTTAAHLLGYVGKMSSTEVEEYLEKGYQMSDLVGKDGIEKTMESYLRGVSGEKVIEQNSLGKVTSTTYSVDPQPGNNVMLTIDKKLQETAERSLAETIRTISENGKRRDPSGRSKNGWDADSGACVVLKADTGEVLVSASYPSYNPATINRDYNELAADPAKPFINRAIAGAYEPGSTFKMATALAGLEEGVITVKTTIYDKGVYTYYKGYQPKCWVYDDYGYTHKEVDVVKALKVSCNYFFYETGRLLGIDKLNVWCKQLGMGQKTGIELIGESAGKLAGPEEREKSGGTWYAGDTLQAAIGQSDNLLTPLQLANYVATIANGGTRRQPTLLKSVRSYLYDEELFANETKVLNTIDIDPEYYDAIMAGMQAVTEDGTASNVFGNYPITVGGKTGTASVSKGSPTGVFVAVAPLEDPEIVVAIVVEHGTHGNYVAKVARDIFDAYFADRDLGSAGVVQENALIP